jgi:hypothetical protein
MFRKKMKSMRTLITRHISLVCLSGLLLLLGACTKDDSGRAEPTGTLQLNLTVAGKVIPLHSKAAGDYNPLDISTLWIYKVESDGAGGTAQELIRKYKPATSVPDNLYLVSGRYKVVIEAGDRSEATYTNKTYAGESVFDLNAHETKIVPIECKITNVAVRVQFDATVAQKFDKGYHAYVCASDNFSQTDAENGLVPTLLYPKDSTGFFLLPEGTSNLSWCFSGESSDPDVNKNNTKTGKIELPQGGMQYTLNFKYSKTPDGYLTVVVKVQEYVNVFDDSFIFSPEPSVMGDGFGIGGVTGYYSDPVKFNVASINPLSSLKFTAKSTNTTYEVLHDGQLLPEAAANGITYTVIDNANGSLALTPLFFEQLEGGINTLDFEVTDNDNNTGKASARVAVAKPVEIAAQDLWFGIADMSAIVTNPATTSVGVRYRLQGTSSWTTIAAQKGSDGYTYTARATDFKPGKTYECQLLENDSESGTVKTAATAAGVQVPNAGFEEWHQSGNPWYPYAQGGEEFWGTGNPGSTSIGANYNITTRQNDPRPGSSGQYCAKLQTTNVVIKKAAGNIFVGSFGEVLGTAGTVYMGRAFAFNAKPTALRVWYKGNVGSGDKARIFVCLTNMTKPGCTYHTVNTKSSEIDKTVLDPTQEFLYTNLNDPSTLEGHIIGYGDLLIEQSQSSWKQVDIPIHYRDKYASEKPNVLILTASASYRGDYFEGSTDSNLYLDDIEFIYE